MSASLPPLLAGGAAAPLTTAIQPAITLSGPKYMARDHLPEGKRAEYEAYAEKLLADPDFGVMFFVELIKQFEISNVPGLDAMLDNIKIRDAGAIGQRVLETTRLMRKVNDDLPELDTKFIAKFNAGRAKAQEVVKKVRYIVDQIKKALQQYQSVLTVMEQAMAFLGSQYQLMVEATLRDDQLAQEADERTDKLLGLCAVLEFLQEKAANRLSEVASQLAADPNNAALTGEQERIQSVSPLVIKRLGTLKPMIFMGNLNEKRFLGQRNANAIAAISLGDFVEVGVSQWKTDVVSELDAMQGQAAMMAVTTGVDFMNEQAAKAAEAYEAQMAQAGELLKQMFVKVETMQRVAASIISAGKQLAEDLEQAAKASANAAREVEAGRNQVKSHEQELAAELTRIMKEA
jgi:uncharacterized protein YaaN involved in tellurite resistance